MQVPEVRNAELIGSSSGKAEMTATGEIIDGKAPQPHVRPDRGVVQWLDGPLPPGSGPVSDWRRFSLHAGGQRRIPAADGARMTDR
jgi:hypothetical protein